MDLHIISLIFDIVCITVFTAAQQIAPLWGK